MRNIASQAAQFFLTIVFLGWGAGVALAQHHAGQNCLECHAALPFAGTVFSDSTGATVQSGVAVRLTGVDGSEIALDNSNEDGNIVSPVVPDGDFLIRIGAMTSRTWHAIPAQASCNVCHVVGGNGSAERSKRFTNLHTQLPTDNDCRHCHHFPASMAFAQLMTPGVLNAAASPAAAPGSQVEIAGQVYPFEPDLDTMWSYRGDIFALGYFSMFDAILATAAAHDIPVEFHFDSLCGTHFITAINDVPGDYWYHFSYDAGTGNTNEIQNRRANRWDETLWRPGVWVRVVEGENVAEIRAEYLEEIERETAFGHRIPRVQFAINPSLYQGNPDSSGRITVTRTFNDVNVAAHNWRATGYPSPYSKPFRPGVVTSLDIVLSLVDQGLLSAATGVFYTRFAGHYIDSYYVVELGFPEAGTAHASGRQGFVYTTENGTPTRLPNNANSLFHITCDVAVLHAPDFSSWRWAELGNPYYETDEPSGVGDPMVDEDYAAMPRGFNLHPPYPNPFNGPLRITFNMFQLARARITLYNALGQEIETLWDAPVENLGVHTLWWEPKTLASGSYYIAMTCNNQLQVRAVRYVR